MKWIGNILVCFFRMGALTRDCRDLKLMTLLHFFQLPMKSDTLIMAALVSLQK